MPAYVEAEHEVWIPELGAHAPDTRQFLHGRGRRFDPRSRAAWRIYAVVTHARQKYTNSSGGHTTNGTIELVSCGSNNDYRVPACAALRLHDNVDDIDDNDTDCHGIKKKTQFIAEFRGERLTFENARVKVT